VADYHLARVNVTRGGYVRNESQRREEQRVCYELRLLGHPIREVARLASEELGWNVSEEVARRRIEAEGLQRVQPAEDALRSMELDRLDRYLLATEKIAYEAPDGPTKLAALDRALKVQERRSKLLGLDAPTRTDVTVTEADPRDGELAAMIRAEKARRNQDEAAV